MSSPLLCWLKETETAGRDSAHAIAIDHMGHVFISGYTSTDTEHGGADAFLAKYDTDGHRLWLQNTETAAYDRSNAIAIDHLGQVYISGITIENTGGKWDAFLAKYDADGHRLWLQKTEATAYARSSAVATDHLGYVYVSGSTATGSEHGHEDAFLAKYDGDGQRLWFIKTETAAHDEADAITVDHLGHIYITGAIRPGVGQGGEDFYLAKYDADGQRLWFRQMETAAYDEAHAIALDHLGHVFISGSIVSEASEWDVFLAKYDTDGNQLWYQKTETPTSDQAHALATDQWGNVFVGGFSEADAEHGYADAFVAKYDAHGHRLWFEKNETAANDKAFAIATDQLGHIFISGFTKTKAEYGGSDAFLAKYMDNLSVTQHHLLLENKLHKLSNQLEEFQHTQLPVDLDWALIQATNDRTRGRGESRVSKAEAKEIIALAEAEGRLTETRKKTLAYIYAKYQLTRGAKEQIKGVL